MKIMYVVSHLEKCGPINVLFNIVKEVKKEHDCTIVSLSPEKDKSMIEEFEKLGINIVQLNLSRKENSKKILTELEKTINLFKPDIVHSHGYRSDYYSHIVGKKKNYLHVTTLHNFPFSDYPNLYGLIQGYLLAISHILVIGKIKHKIACSHSIAKKFNQLKISKISVVQNGIDNTLYKPVTKEGKEELRNKLMLPQEKKIIISIGALIKRKRPIKLMEVFQKNSFDDKALFLVIGDGVLFNKAKKYESESTILLGSIKNVADYLKASDIFISNSKSEGLPMAMLEAASTGLFVVGSDIAPHRELMDTYQNKTLLYKSQNNKEIVKNVKKALENIDEIKFEKEKPFKLSSYNMASNYLNYYRNMKVK